MHQDRSPSPAIVWLPLVLMLAALLLRVLTQHDILDGMPNFSPLLAFAFVGTILFPKPMPWWSWVVILLGVDVLSQGTALWSVPGVLPTVLLTYGCYALAAWWGGRLRGKTSILETLVGTLTCSIVFYVVTNTFCWWIEPSYAKTGAGWVQCLTVGSPGPWPSTLVFFRNSLIADFTGATLLIVAYNAEALLRKLRGLPWMSESKSLSLA